MTESARWVVYMASDDGAILISQPEDAPPLGDLGALDPRRIPHVIGRGTNEIEATADARRQLAKPREALTARYGPAHRRLREEVLGDPEVKCCVGFPEGVHEAECVPPTSIVYIKPLEQGGPTTRDNVQALCRSCVGAKSKYDNADAWRRR